jgi:hypothetical protein
LAKTLTSNWQFDLLTIRNGTQCHELELAKSHFTSDALRSIPRMQVMDRSVSLDPTGSLFGRPTIFELAFKEVEETMTKPKMFHEYFFYPYFKFHIL